MSLQAQSTLDARCKRKQMEPAVADRSVHTGRKQHQRNCPQICVLACGLDWASAGKRTEIPRCESAFNPLGFRSYEHIFALTAAGRGEVAAHLLGAASEQVPDVHGDAARPDVVREDGDARVLLRERLDPVREDGRLAAAPVPDQSQHRLVVGPHPGGFPAVKEPRCFLCVAECSSSFCRTCNIAGGSGDTLSEYA